MTNPIVIAYHLIWTAYGWWLPNDPRGSHSKVIAIDILKQLGESHKGRKRIQPPGYEVRSFYQHAEALLKYPLITFSDHEFLNIAASFARVVEDKRYTCYACAMMPDHIHILIRKHKDPAEKMIENFQIAGKNAIAGTGAWESKHPVFTTGGWKVFLDEPDEIWRTIRYIENNPDKIGLPKQHWNFVRPYDNWPLHEGHSPNSPYAKRLRALGRYRC